MYALSFGFKFFVCMSLYFGVLYVVCRLPSSDDPSQTVDDHPHD